jgi:hypothetical protein
MVNNRGFLSSVLLPALLVAGISVPTHALNRQTEQLVSASTSQPPATDVTGTWSGTFYSKHSNVAPFTITVVISADAVGHLTGSSSLNSDCLKGAQLHITISGSKIVLAGSDPEGDNITVRGTLDNTSRQMATTYVLNGAATGKCETDDGNGNLGKR